MSFEKVKKSLYLAHLLATSMNDASSKVTEAMLDSKQIVGQA